MAVGTWDKEKKHSVQQENQHARCGQNRVPGHREQGCQAALAGMTNAMDGAPAQQTFTSFLPEAGSPRSRCRPTGFPVKRHLLLTPPAHCVLMWPFKRALVSPPHKDTYLTRAVLPPNIATYMLRTQHMNLGDTMSQSIVRGSEPQTSAGSQRLGLRKGLAGQMEPRTSLSQKHANPVGNWPQVG